MNNEDLVKFYKENYEKKIFLTKLNDKLKNAYLMYVYTYEEEIKNFCDTFLVYLPYYVRSSDQLTTILKQDIKNELIKRSKSIKQSSDIPIRKPEVNGLYGELFLDFYLRIVLERKAFITYAQKKPFRSNNEINGPDNVVYFVKDKKINICFCEAKFIEGASKSKDELLDDINGKNTQESHISAKYLNDYMRFMICNKPSICNEDKKQFEYFLREMNNHLDTDNLFIDELINLDVCCNFIFFAIFDSTQKKPIDFRKNYDEIYNAAYNRIVKLGIKNYKIEIVFIPTNNKPIVIKKEIEKAYE